MSSSRQNLKINVSGYFADDETMDKIHTMLKGKSNFLSAFTSAAETTQGTSSRRDQWKPNTTVAAVIERDGKFLMIEEYAHGRLVLNQPAGHLEQGETLIQAAVREVREESAWGFIPESVVGLYLYPSPNKDITYLRVCFAGKCCDHMPDQPLDNGIQRTIWMSEEELGKNAERLRTPLVLDCVRDYIAGNRMPLSMVKSRLS